MLRTCGHTNPLSKTKSSTIQSSCWGKTYLYSHSKPSAKEGETGTRGGNKAIGSIGLITFICKNVMYYISHWSFNVFLVCDMPKKCWVLPPLRFRPGCQCKANSKTIRCTYDVAVTSFDLVEPKSPKEFLGF